MTVYTGKIRISTKGRNDMLDITVMVEEAVSDSKISDGLLVVFCPGSTGALSTVEFEPGLCVDLPDALEKIAPYGGDYKHHETWNDDNGSGHVKATLIGPDITVPLCKGALTLGTWQQIVFIECDTRNRERELIVQVVGE